LRRDGLRSGSVRSTIEIATADQIRVSLFDGRPLVMAKRTTAPPSPPSPAVCEQVLETVRSATGPVTTTELRKRLDPAVKLAAKVLTPILEEAVASGKLLRLPPKSAKGPSRYWDRDPGVMLRAATVQAIETAAAPFTAKELVGRLKPLKVTEIEL